jgi:hypothetical protein
MKWVSFRRFQGTQLDIRIQFRPMELVRPHALYRTDLSDCGKPEDGIIGERNEVLPVINQKPESQPCNTRDLTERNVCARH